MIEYVFALAGLLALAGMVRGPTYADRSLAAGVLISVTIVIFLLFASMSHAELYLDIAVVMIFMSFVGTLAISKYVRRD